MTPPRVLIVSHTYTAAMNRAKLDALAQHVSLAALVPHRWRDVLFTVESKARPMAYTLHQLPSRFNGHILRYFYPFRALIRILWQTQPDLVYVEEESASLALAQFAFLKRRYKLICFAWENILRRVGLPGLERYNLNRCDAAIAGNADAAQVLCRKKFGAPIVVTPQLGIDSDFFQPTRSTELRKSLGLEEFTVGYIGRLVEEKGLWALLTAITALPKAKLLIVGSGPLRAEIDRWISARHFDHRIRIVNSVPHEEIPGYLNALDVLVLPSQTAPTWKEQFGHVLIEGMACGVPVIGSNSGAIPEIIADAGLIFPERDIAALRDAIASLQSNPTRRAQLSDAGRARVLAHYTQARIAAANVKFFKQVLEQ